MNLILKLIPASWIETFVRKQAGVWINKGLTIAATALVGHNLMAQTASASWIDANKDMLIGIVVALVSAYITKARGDVRSADLEHAHQSLAEEPLSLPPASNFITGGGVGSGNTKIPSIIAACLLCGSLYAADTNTPASDPIAPLPVLSELATNGIVNPMADIAKAFYKATRTGAGYGINLHGDKGATILQQLDLFGWRGTNMEWAVGMVHSTFFIPAANEEQLGVGVGGSWEKAPRILKFALFNADHIQWQVSVCEPVETYWNVQAADWNRTTFAVHLTRSF